MHPSAMLKRVTNTYKQDVTFFLGVMELKKIGKGFFANITIHLYCLLNASGLKRKFELKINISWRNVYLIT